nr:MAG TPA: hypothetical protein [Crassvirales sp.]
MFFKYFNDVYYSVCEDRVVFYFIYLSFSIKTLLHIKLLLTLHY